MMVCEPAPNEKNPGLRGVPLSHRRGAESCTAIWSESWRRAKGETVVARKSGVSRFLKREQRVTPRVCAAGRCAGSARRSVELAERLRLLPFWGGSI